ncbi:MAG: hypothetical protein V1816_26410 [Pseudomonadota bacterium]
MSSVFCSFFKTRVAVILFSVLILLPAGSVQGQDKTPAVDENAVTQEPQKKQDQEKEAEDKKDAYELEGMVIYGTVENPATGASTIGPNVIPNLPKGNGSINEMLRILPQVQFSDTANTSLQGGEILPPDVSISGGRVYQNNFLIDGISNNNLLDPTADNPNHYEEVPANPQEFFLNADLVDEITVYDSNVPAKYGWFTGGVVDATTKRHGPGFGGKISYRTTRHEWTSIHVSDEDNYDFENSDSHDMQPRFEKHFAGASLNVPFSESMGALASYQLNYSRIPLDYLGSYKNQWRLNQNVLTKFSVDLADVNFLDLSLLVAPYEGKYFIKNTLNSDFTIRGGGYGGMLNYSHDLNAGELTLKGGYRISENSRNAPTNLRSWATSKTKWWGRLVDNEVSVEGGWGDIENRQETLELKSDMVFTDFETGFVGHRVNVGGEYSNVRGVYKRKDTHYQYMDAKLNSDIECDDPYTCVSGEQFFTRRIVREAESVDVSMNQFAAYLEDTLNIWRFKITSGIRYDYDDYLENHNVAPRLRAAFDIFGNNSTLLIGGLNRYYGHSFLSYKLRESKKIYYTQTRTAYHNKPTDWALSTGSESNKDKFSDLKTPYSDEAAVGVDQALLGGRLKLTYVSRENKDEFAREYGSVQPNGLRYYQMNNNGKSNYHGFRASWERTWERHYLSVNATYQQTKTSNEDPEDLLDDEALTDRVWYKGSIRYKSELPRGDYNRPWVANLTYIIKMGYGFSFTNFTKFRAGYQNLEDTGNTITIPAGAGYIDPLTGEGVAEELPIYEKIKRPDAVLFDWRLSWDWNIYTNYKLTLAAEVDNVFDVQIKAGNSDTTYEMGRQLWLSAELTF